MANTGLEYTHLGYSLDRNLYIGDPNKNTNRVVTFEELRKYMKTSSESGGNTFSLRVSVSGGPAIWVWSTANNTIDLIPGYGLSISGSNGSVKIAGCISWELATGEVE